MTNTHRYNLNVDRPSLYSYSLSPNIFNGFATAAFRFGHTLIPSDIMMMGKDNKETSKVKLKNSFFNTDLLLRDKMAEILRGMCNQPAEMFNSIMTDDVRNFLFKEGHAKFGGDLAARNIQRGRDHELANYDSFRLAVGLSSLSDSFFSRPPREMSPYMWNKFDKIYGNPKDLELFPGGISETPVEGGVVGETFGRILGLQFRKLKLGDR